MWFGLRSHCGLRSKLSFVPFSQTSLSFSFRDSTDWREGLPADCLHCLFSHHSKKQHNLNSCPVLRENKTIGLFKLYCDLFAQQQSLSIPYLSGILRGVCRILDLRPNQPVGDFIVWCFWNRKSNESLTRSSSSRFRKGCSGIDHTQAPSHQKQ